MGFNGDLMGFNGDYAWLPSGKRLQQNYGKIHHAMKMGKSTILTGSFSMSQTVSLPEGIRKVTSCEFLVLIYCPTCFFIHTNV